MLSMKSQETGRQAVGEFGLAGHEWTFSIFHLVFVEFGVHGIELRTDVGAHACRSHTLYSLISLSIPIPFPFLHAVIPFGRSLCRMPCPVHCPAVSSPVPLHLSTCLLSIQMHSLEVESKSGVVLLDENSRCSLDGFSPNSTLIVDDPILSYSVV